MPSNYPNSYDNFVDPSGNTFLNDPVYDHAKMHTNANDALSALEHFVGLTATPNFILSGTDPHPSYFPANNAGLNVLTQTPDEVTGSNSSHILEVAADQTILGIQLAGDAYPRWYLTSDSIDGLYAGPGNIDPWYYGAQFSYDDVAGCFVAQSVWSGATPNFAITRNTKFYQSPGDPNTQTFLNVTNSSIAIDINEPTLWINKGGSSTGWVKFLTSDQATPNLIGETGTTDLNVALGYGAMNVLSPGGLTSLPAKNDVAIGVDALQNDTGGQNTAVGYKSMQANTNGTNNVAIGYETLQLHTSGASNVAIGSSALSNDTIGYRNIALGNLALTANVDGYENTAIGHAALSSSIHVSDNTAVGVSSQQDNTAGSFNVSLGTYSLAQDATPSYSVAIGHSAMYLTTNAIADIAIGYQSLYNDTGGSNTAVGYQALMTKTAGHHNIAIGYNSNNNAATPNYAIAIGAATSATADGSVAIGVDHTGAAASSATPDYIVLGTANHTVETLGPLGVGGTSFGSGSGPMIFLANEAATPSTNPVGGGIFYALAGSLYWFGSNGTLTKIANA